MWITLTSAAVSVFLGNKLLANLHKIKKIVVLFFAIIIIQSLFTSSGTNLIRMGSISILTTEGLRRGIEIILRMMIIILSAAIITTSTSREMIQGLVQWKIPYEIAFMTSVAIRFLPVMVQEMKDVLTAIQLRGVELKKIPVQKKYQIYSYILMPIVISSIIKAQRLSIAMETRGFRAYPYRTSYMILKMSLKDYIIIGTALLTTLLTIFLYYVYW
jgi:energy-coupling factor transport system permease protein